MKDKIQASLKSVLAEADTLIKDVGSREATEAENSKLSDLSTKATQLAQQIDQLTKLEAAKAFGQESAGSFVAASFSREALDGEGNLPGISADPISGEMYVNAGSEFKSAGQKKLDALKNGGYKDAFADYIRSEGLKRPMKGDAMKILSEGTDTAGGFWIPPDYRPELIKKIATMSTVRPNATVYTTGTDHITFPAVNYNGNATDDVNANLFTSGVRFSWRSSIGSTTDITEATNPIAGQINIPVNLATCAIIMTREQLEDSAFDILGYISNLGAEAFALGEEQAYTRGNGAGQPQGWLEHPANANSTASTTTYIAYSTYATRAGSTYWGNTIMSGSTTIAWGTITTGITGTEAQLPPQYETNAKWFANKTTYASIRAINAGTATLPQWSLGDSYPNYSNGMSPSLIGYSIVKNQFMPSVATGNAYLALADLSGYYIIDRVGLSVEVFREVYGLRDQVVVYMRKRTGGQLVHYWKTKIASST